MNNYYYLPYSEGTHSNVIKDGNVVSRTLAGDNKNKTLCLEGRQFRTDWHLHSRVSQGVITNPDSYHNLCLKLPKTSLSYIFAKWNTV